MESETRRATRAAGVVSAATFLSRIFGFLRDMAIAGFFGAGMGADAFFVAFRIPNLLRRLFAEGSLSIAFIPVFTDYLENRGREAAFELARSALRLLSAILAGLTLLGILLAPVLVRLIAPGFAESADKMALTIALTRITFPYIFFICLVALCMGVLNVLGHFAAPALAPVFLNLAIILSVFFISPHLAEPAVGLAIGVLIGGLLQLGLQVPFLLAKGVRFWERAAMFHPGLKRVGRLMLPAVFGAAVYQINILVGTLLASLLPEGSVSYLYYADRLVQFPLGIFAIALATAVLPSLSRQAAARNMAGLHRTFGQSMNLIFFITLPAMIGLIVLREPIVAFLFERGAFGARTTELTAEALFYYSIGLWAFSSVRIVVATFYALEDTRTPVQMATISIIANILLSMLLMGPMEHAGLALATSLASMINLVLLIRRLRERMTGSGWGDSVKSACKSLLCSAIMGILVWFVAFRLLPANGGGPEQGLRIVAGVASGGLSYVLLARWVKSPELAVVAAVIRKKTGTD
jgi:putative peptidoglycan lipid II flippase